MNPRIASLTRTTKETTIAVQLNLDGQGTVSINTGVAFFDHMLSAFGRHGRFDLTVEAQGDLEVDAHHTVEDTGIVLGTVFQEALGDKRGIERFASPCIVMDEALVLVACDISGRGFLSYAMDLPIEIIGTFDTTLAKEFFLAFVAASGVTTHIRSIAGENSHHILEAAFKGFGRALRQATRIDAATVDILPTTKGVL